jgi:hypothetical protein
MTPNAPGLKRRTRADGSAAYYWVASAVSRLAGEYPVKTVPLHYDSDESRAIRCQVLTDELKRWLAANGKEGERHFDGTIGGLIRQYQTLDTSPYFAVQEITRKDYDYRLVLIDRTVGGVAIANVWNRDSRAGGITEAWDSNAQEKDIQRLATHSDPAMTRRYARNSLASTTRVAALRVAGRERSKNET